MSMRRQSGGFALLVALGFLGWSQLTPVKAAAPDLPVAKRVQVTGEVIETWCSVSAIMYAYGTAHHQCAAWCTAGGIPVGLKDKDGNYYMILRIEADEGNVANPRLAHFLSHDVSVDGDLIERDGVKYLLITKVTDDKGVVNMTHEQNGIVPFGN
jgi:hypothetical protein